MIPDYAEQKACARCGRVFPWYCPNCAARYLGVDLADVAPVALVIVNNDLDNLICRDCLSDEIAAQRDFAEL